MSNNQVEKIGDAEALVDLENRDPNDMNQHVRVLFEDIFAEPEGAHSADCVWTNAYKCFNGSKKCCYLFLTYLCALPMSCLWGWSFACLSFQYIWDLNPCIKYFEISLACPRRVFQVFLECMLAPLCETCSLCFSKIKVSNS